jgi:hypothetical protein
MKLFRVAMKSTNSFDKKIRTLYIIQPNINEAIHYVNQTKKSNFEIYKVYYLGFELSKCLFKGGKEGENEK